jgi:HK97 family phage major capsid protein
MTQSARDYLQAEVDRKLAEATSITDAAQKAARSLGAEERSKVEGLLSEVTTLKSRIQEIDDNQKIAESIEKARGSINLPTETADAPSTSGKSFGQVFTESENFKSLQTAFKSGGLTGNWSSGPVEIPFDGKATVTSTASPILQADVQGGINPFALRRLTVADLLAAGTTDSSVVRYVSETANTNAAAAVAEGDVKPESTIVFGTVDEPVRKIATFLPITDEMLEDAAQLRSYLDGRLRLFVQHEEERQLLSGSGTAPNLRGLLNRTGVQTVAVPATGAARGVEYVFDAITAIRTSALVEPDGIVINPTDYARIRKAKDNDGQYYGGGPFGSLEQNRLWELPVVVTGAIPSGTVLVGAFKTQAQVFRRNGLTVEASNSHADFFQRNLTAIRAEERLALAVYRPAAFHTITNFGGATF